MFLLAILLVIVCGLFEWKPICAVFFHRLFIYVLMLEIQLSKRSASDVTASDVTHDNCILYGNVRFRRFRTKILVSKSMSPECVLFSSRYIYQFVLPVFICVCVRVAIYYFGFPVFIDAIEGTNKRTNERTDGQLFLILYTHRFARG
jgi:hypothetical protein